MASVNYVAAVKSVASEYSENQPENAHCERLDKLGSVDLEKE